MSTEINISEEMVMNQICVIRGQKVMLDRDLAILYNVETRAMKQAVKRNLDRFPEDFMFKVSDEELQLMVSQFVRPDKKSFGGANPFAFTEQGVAMLSNILNSKQAVQVNIRIIRIFTKLRQYLSDHTEVRLEIAEIKQVVHKIMSKQDNQDKNIALLFNYIDRLQDKAEEEKLVERKGFGYKIGGGN